MFLAVEILNEGKVLKNSAKGTKTRLLEWESPKSYLTDTKLAGCKSTKSLACVNSNWQKLRG